jgi:hypothetical protein
LPAATGKTMATAGDDLDQGLGNGSKDSHAGVGPLDLALIDEDLVEHDQRRLAAEQPAEVLGSTGDGRPALVLDPPAGLGPDERLRQVAPEAVGAEPIDESQPVGRVAFLAVERRHADLSIGE